MGGELVRGPSSEKEEGGETSALNSYAKVFHELFPFYLSIGMTPHEYWEEDCTLVRDYLKAHEMKKHRDNEMMWVQGAYIYNAILSVSPILHAFAKPGTRPRPYMDRPIPITETEALEQEEDREREAYENMRRRVSSWAEGVNKRYAGGEGQDG